MMRSPFIGLSWLQRSRPTILDNTCSMIILMCGISRQSICVASHALGRAIVGLTARSCERVAMATEVIVGVGGDI